VALDTFVSENELDPIGNRSVVLRGFCFFLTERDAGKDRATCEQ
jgi:hypothetical protein